MDERLKAVLRERISTLPERSVATAMEILENELADWDGENLEEANGPDAEVRRVSRVEETPLLDAYEIVKSKAGTVDVADLPEPLLNVMASGMFGWRSDGKRFVVLTLAGPPFEDGSEIIISKGGVPDSWNVGIRKIPDGIDEEAFLKASGLARKRFGMYVEKTENEIPKAVMRIVAAFGGTGMLSITHG